MFLQSISEFKSIFIQFTIFKKIVAAMTTSQSKMKQKSKNNNNSDEYSTLK